MKQKLARHELKLGRLYQDAFESPGSGLQVTGYIDPVYVVNRNQRTASFPCGHDAVDVASQPRSRRCIAQRHLAIAEDRAQDVVEVVRNAARQRTHRLQPLRQAQLLLEAAQLLLGALLLRDIHSGPHELRINPTRVRPDPGATHQANWRARQDSNPRPDGPKPSALSTELQARCFGNCRCATS